MGVFKTTGFIGLIGLLSAVGQSEMGIISDTQGMALSVLGMLTIGLSVKLGKSYGRYLKSLQTAKR